MLQRKIRVMHAGMMTQESGHRLAAAYLKDGSYGQQKCVEIGILSAALSATVHMQTNNGKDNEEQ